MTETTIQHVSTSKLSCKSFIHLYFCRWLYQWYHWLNQMVPLAAETVQGSLITRSPMVESLMVQLTGLIRIRPKSGSPSYYSLIFKKGKKDIET